MVFSYLLAEKFSCLIMFSKKEFAIVYLRFISRHIASSAELSLKKIYNLEVRCIQFFNLLP